MGDRTGTGDYHRFIRSVGEAAYAPSSCSPLLDRFWQDGAAGAISAPHCSQGKASGGRGGNAHHPIGTVNDRVPSGSCSIKRVFLLGRKALGSVMGWVIHPSSHRVTFHLVMCITCHHGIKVRNRFDQM